MGERAAEGKCEDRNGCCIRCNSGSVRRESLEKRGRAVSAEGGG
jgi:hypothetical protein